jgi:predicted phage tail protein
MGGLFGGSSGGSTGYVAADTLMSKTLVRCLDLVSEGPCVGPAAGLSSIYFNRVPLQSPTDGVFSVLGVTADWRLGYPEQSIMTGFSDVENEVQVGQIVKANNGPIVQTVQNANVSAVRIKISVGNFVKGDANGDANPTTVLFQLQYMSYGGQWTTGYYDSSFIRYTSNPSGPTDGVKCMTSLDVPAGGQYNLIFYYRPLGSPTWIVGGTYAGVNAGAATTFYPEFSALAIPYAQYETTLSETFGNGVGRLGNYNAYHNLNAWINLTGKTESGFIEDYRMELPAGGAPWEIRVIRITPDATDFNGAANYATYTQDQITFASYTEIIDSQVMYSDSMVFGITADTEYDSNGIPTRGYDVYGRIIRVPSNYNAYTRAYTGIWDGTFTLSWTNNPVWCFLDILTHERYGLGQWINDDYLDFSTLYTIAKYCDEFVEDGRGGTEPRFVFNTQITSQSNAYDVLNMFAGTFRGMIYWATGQVMASQDAPGPVSRVVTRANVLSSGFAYTGVPLNARHSVVLVTWNDPANFYTPTVDVVEDADLIARFGYITIDITAFGCTSRGQARRMGRWTLDTEKYATDVVTYRAGWDHADAVPGEIISVSDPAYAGLRQGGRVVSATATSVTMDAPYTFSNLETYVMSVVIPTWGRVAVLNGSNVINGSGTAFNNSLLPLAANDIIIFEGDNRQYELAATPTSAGSLALTTVYAGTSRTGQNFSVFRSGTLYYSSFVTVVDVPVTPGLNGAYAVVPLAGTLPAAPNNGVPFVITGTDVAPRLFRIVNNREIAPQTFEISALEYDPTKYARVETGYQAITTKKLIDDTSQIAAPTNIVCSEAIYVANNQVRTKLTISWGPVPDTRINYYQLVYSFAGSPFQILSGTSDVSYTMTDETPGLYTFGVRAIATIGGNSAFSYISYTALGKSAPPADVTHFTATRTISGVQLSWNAVADLDVVGYEIRQGSSWDGGSLVTTQMNGTTEFVVLNDTNNHTFFIKALDDTKHYSVNAVSVVTSVAPPDDVQNFYATQDNDRVIFNWNKVNGTDIRYEIREGDSFAIGRKVALVSGNTANVMYPLTQNRKFWIKSLSGVGLYSLNAGFAEVLLVAVQTRNVIYTDDQSALAWPGFCYGMTPSGFDNSELSMQAGVLTGHYEFQIDTGYPDDAQVRARTWFDYNFVSDAATPQWQNATFLWTDPQAQVAWQPLLDLGNAQVNWFIATIKAAATYPVTVQEVWSFEIGITGTLNGTAATQGKYVTGVGATYNGTSIVCDEPGYTISVAATFTLQITVRFTPSDIFGAGVFDQALQLAKVGQYSGSHMVLWYKNDTGPRLLLSDGNPANDISMTVSGTGEQRWELAIVQDSFTRSLYMYDLNSTLASRASASIAASGTYSTVAA